MATTPTPGPAGAVDDSGFTTGRTAPGAETATAETRGPTPAPAPAEA